MINHDSDSSVTINHQVLAYVSVRTVLVTFIIQLMVHNLLLPQQLSVPFNWEIDFFTSHQATLQTALEMFAEQKAIFLPIKHFLFLCTSYLWSYDGGLAHTIWHSEDGILQW